MSLNPDPLPAPPHGQRREDPLSEALRQAHTFGRIASLAPQLTDAELRVLLALAPGAIASEHFTVTASSRQIEKLTALTRANVRLALKRLSARRLIVQRKGTATSSTAIWLQFVETVVLPGPAVGGIAAIPPPHQGGITTSPPVGSQQSQYVGLLQSHPGIFTIPPPTENEGLPHTGHGVDIDIDSDTIDRLLKAKPTDFDPQRRSAARQWLHGYALKFGREPDCHPPDDRIVAQFLAIAPWPRLEGLLYELMAERKAPGSNYAAWFIAVALQRIHGIAPGTLARRRLEQRRGFKVVAAPEPVRPPAAQQLELTTEDPPAADPQFAADLVGQLAAAKGVRHR